MTFYCDVVGEIKKTPVLADSVKYTHLCCHFCPRPSLESKRQRHLLTHLRMDKGSWCMARCAYILLINAIRILLLHT